MRPCTKRKFKLLEALKVRDKMNRRDGKNRREYLCPNCNNYHLTSMSEQTFYKIKEIKR